MEHSIENWNKVKYDSIYYTNDFLLIWHNLADKL